MKHHPITKLFPPMTAAEYDSLKASIAEIGQKEAVWTWQGVLIDGVNRQRACEELKLPLVTREWDGEGSLVAFVAAMNKDRRHLSEDQKVHIAVDLVTEFAKEAKKRQKASGGDQRSKKAKATKTVEPNSAQPNGRAPQARDQAAATMGVKKTRVEEGKKIKEEAPDLHRKVKQGEMTHAQAKTEMKRRKKRAKLAEQAAAAPANDQAPRFTIMRGDCLVELRKVESKSVRLVFADPPYNIGIDYGLGKKADQLPFWEYLVWCSNWMASCCDKLTDDGSMWVLINHEHAAFFELMLRGDVILQHNDPDDELQQAMLNALPGVALSVLTGMQRLHIRSWVTWYETFGVNHASGFNRCSRRLLHCVKDPNSFVFNPDAVNRPSARQAKYEDDRADPGGKTWDDVWGVEHRDKDGVVVVPAIPRLTQTCDERLPDFPTQLPLALLRPIIACASEPGDLILDPFSGSATAGVAALGLGRRYIGIEKTESYANASELRLKGVKCE